MAPSVPPVLRPSSSPPRRLDDFVQHFGLLAHGDLEGHTTGITLTTDDVRPGDIFVAVSGARAHGADFAEAAAERGAIAIVTDTAGASIAAGAGLPVLVADDPRARLADMSAWVYGNVDGMPLILGVTGTNGKTTVVHLQDALLTQMGLVSGMSSSAERHIAGECFTARLTTPESSELQALIARMRERNVEVIALEVSVQGLMRHRVDGIVFDVVGFTNLQYDHMDDFADMDEYLQAKLPLFRADRARRAVVSLDTPAGETVAETARDSGVPVVTISTPEISMSDGREVVGDWTVVMQTEKPVHTEFTLTSRSGRTLTTSAPVTGPHMAANAGLAIVMLLEAGYDWDHLVATLERDAGIRTVLPGRTEIVTTGRGPVVYLDFAHTPDGFEMTAKAVRRVTAGRLVTLIGADGSRDASKRPAMGAAAALNSDVCIVTDHHPRWEEAGVIREALYRGAVAARPTGDVSEISPPEKAVDVAVSQLGENDALLWFGPGHQDFREIQGVRHPYSPRTLVMDALERAGWGAHD